MVHGRASTVAPPSRCGTQTGDGFPSGDVAKRGLVRIALVQVASPPQERYTDRLPRVGEMVADCRGCDMVFLPELWPSGYFGFDNYEREAQPLDGHLLETVAGWARSIEAHVHLGSFLERSLDGRLHNTAVLLDPLGQLIHQYRKVHVFGYRSREAELLTPGSTVQVVRTPFGGFSASTCYDLRFPELFRSMVDGGAEVIAVPAAWPAVRIDHWRLLTSARAVEEQVVLIACNAAGTQGDAVHLAGRSRVVDPWGTVLAEAGDDEEILIVDVDPSVVRTVREEFPVLRDRRPFELVSGTDRPQGDPATSRRPPTRDPVDGTR